jgi:hypothetical protein
MMLGDTLPHSLPWYFGLTLFLIWLAAMVALALLIRRRLKAKAESRRVGGRRPGDHVRDDHSLGPGKDVEPW